MFFSVVSLWEILLRGRLSVLFLNIVKRIWIKILSSKNWFKIADLLLCRAFPAAFKIDLVLKKETLTNVGFVTVWKEVKKLLQTGLVLSEEITGNLNLPMHIGDASHPGSKVIFWASLKHINWEIHWGKQLEAWSIRL